MRPGRNVSMRRGSDLSSAPGARPQAEIRIEAPSQKPKVIVKIFDTVIATAIFLIFFGLPLFFTGLTFQGVVFEKQIYFYFLILVALVTWAAKGVISGEMKIRRTPLDIPIAAFLAIYILSTIFSIDRWHSFWGFFGDPSRGLMSIIALVIAYYVIVSHFSEKLLKLILTAIAGSAVLLSIWTTLAILGVKFLPQKLLAIAPLSLVGSVSGAILYFSVMIPILITIIFALRVSKSSKPMVKNIASAILLVTLALSMFLILALYNFAPWVALLPGLGVFLIYILSRIVRPTETWTWLPMAVFVLVMAILMIGAVNITRVNLPIEVSPAANISAEIAKEAVKDKFILGSGPGTYGYNFSLYRPQSFNQNMFYNLRFYQGTGILGEAIPTLGVLGVVAVMLVVLTFVGSGFYLLTKDREKNKIYSLGLFSAMIILTIFAFTARVEGTILIWATVLGSLTVAVLLWESAHEEKVLNLTIKASPKYALALAFVFMVVTAGVAYLFVYVGKAFVADVYAGSASRENEISEQGSISKLIRAVSLYNKEGRYYTRLGQEYMVLANREILKSEEERDINAVQKYLNNSIAASVRGRDLMKKDVLSQETLAQIYENAGLYVKDSMNLARDTYEGARSLDPHNPNYLVKLGQIKIVGATDSKDENEKKQLISEAKDLFQKSIDEKENFAPGYYQRALIKEVEPDLDGAIEDMTRAANLDRNNITYVFNLGRLLQTRGKGDDDKIAEDLFKKILGINNKEINTHFSLGLLYEKTGRKSEAVGEYRTVLDLLPAQSEDARKRVEKMIENIEAGISNLIESPSQSSEGQTPTQ